jgi:hypothetical protein
MFSVEENINAITCFKGKWKFVLDKVKESKHAGGKTLEKNLIFF